MNMTSFYQNRNFFGERGRPIYRIPSRRNISFYGAENILQHKVMSFFDVVQFERFGRLSGEYLLDQNGLILIDESHSFIMINNSWEDVVSQQVSDYIYNRDNQGRLLDILGRIKTMEAVQGCQILAHPYSNVYFHFIGDMLPSLRFFDGLNDAPVLLDNGLLEQSYQKQYLGRALGGKNVIPFSAPVRVIDPWLAHSAVVRGIAVFIFCPPLALIGWLVGDAIRKFVMPDFILTSGGFSGLLKAKLFWALGPQAIGAGAGLLIGYVIAFTLFPPPLAPLSTVGQWQEFDGEKPFDLLADKNVRAHTIATLAVLLPRNMTLAKALAERDPAAATQRLQDNLRYGDRVRVIAGEKEVYLAVYGCAEEECQSGRGAFLGIGGQEVRGRVDTIGIAFMAVANQEGDIQSSPQSQLPFPLEPAYQAWVSQLRTGLALRQERHEPFFSRMWQKVTSVLAPRHDQPEEKAQADTPVPVPVDPPVAKEAAPQPQEQVAPTGPSMQEPAPTAAPTEEKPAETAPAAETVALPSHVEPIATAPQPPSEEVKPETTPVSPPAAAAPSPAQPTAETPANLPQETTSTSPSFDCAKATTLQEKRVCSDPDLAALDRKLAEVYRAALKESRDPLALKREQAGWVHTVRDPCLDQLACIAAAYQTRIDLLLKQP